MIPWFELQTIMIGPITIQVWGLLVAIGVLVAFWWLTKQDIIKVISEKQVSDIIFYTLIFGFIGARLGHILFYEPSYFIANPSEVIKIWHGGMSSFGGIVAAIISVIYFIKKYAVTKKKVVPLMNYFSKAGVIGWMFGRIGCFLIHDHLGVICDLGCPLHFVALQKSDGSSARLDMSLLELLLLLPLVWFVFISKYKQNAHVVWYIGLYYGAIRFLLDFLRAYDISNADVRYATLTPGQYFGILLMGICMYFLYKAKKHNTTM